MAPTGERWRIDELARRSGVSVDTIRFYLREGLLPSAHREGRITLFDGDHLDRLNRIRELQARRFNLAVIRELLDERRVGMVETLFAGEGAHDRAALLDATAVPPSFLDGLVDVGLLDEPPYDDADVRVVEALRDLVAAGLPEHVVLVLVRLYVEHFATMRREMLDTLAADREVLDGIAGELATIVPLTERVLDYVHRRSVQRMTLESLARDDG